VVILLDNQLNETKNKFFRKHKRLGGISYWNSLAKSAGFTIVKPTNWPFDIKTNIKRSPHPSRKHKTLSD
jgi:hypothetical protein